VKEHRLIDALAIAKQAGAPRSANMALLGAAAPFLGLREESLIFGIRSVFSGRRDRGEHRHLPARARYLLGELPTVAVRARLVVSHLGLDRPLEIEAGPAGEIEDADDYIGELLLQP